MSGVRAGTLRHRVTIKTLSSPQNAIGEAVPTYTTSATTWAEIIPVSGRETFGRQKLRAECTHMVRMRYRAMVTTSVIVFGARVFDIIEILNYDERNIRIDIQCKERLN